MTGALDTIPCMQFLTQDLWHCKTSNVCFISRVPRWTRYMCV